MARAGPGRRSSELARLRRAAADLKREEQWDNEAIELNTNILEKDPEDVAAYCRRGKCYWQCDSLEEAESDYQSALKLSPEGASTVPMIRQAIADIRTRITERDEEARREKEGRERAERELADELQRQSKLLASLSSCEEALVTARQARSDENPDTRFALEAYRRAVELDGSRMDVAVEWATLLGELRHHEQALALYERVLALHPSHTAALTGKAAALVEIHRTDEGLAIADSILAENPADCHARRVKARAHADRGEMPEAVLHYERAESG